MMDPSMCAETKPRFDGLKQRFFAVTALKMFLAAELQISTPLSFNWKKKKKKVEADLVARFVT